MNARHPCLIVAVVLFAIIGNFAAISYATNHSAGADMPAGAEFSNTIFNSSAADQWTRMTTPVTVNLSSIIGGAAFSFAVGDNGTLLHYDGLEWVRIPTPTTVPLNGIWGSSPQNVFIVGAAGNIFHLGTEGITRMPYVTGANLNAVWGLSPSDVYAVGDNGTILHFDGEFWKQEPHLTSSRLRGVGASAHGGVFAVGDKGTIVRYLGDRWERMDTPTTMRLSSVWVFDSGEAVAVGAAGTALRFDGRDWRLVQTPTTSNLNGVWGITTTQVFAVGDNGTIIHFDGGQWTLTRASTASPLTAIHNGFAVGGAGFVFQNAAIFVEAANLRITELDPWSGQVEITNYGPPFATGELPICHRFDCGSSVPAGTVFGAGEIDVFSVTNLDRSDTDLWLYRMMPFSDPNNLIHGVKYGPLPGGGHTAVAVDAGKWPGEQVFAPAPFYGASLAFDGFGTDPKDWYVDETPSFGRADYTTPGTVGRSLYLPGGRQDFEEVLLGDEVVAITDWQIVDQSGIPGMFTARVVDDVLGATGSEGESTRWLRIRDQDAADERNEVLSPMTAAPEQTDYEWAFWVTVEEPSGGDAAHPAVVVQHAAIETGEARSTWGIEFRDDGWYLVVTEFGGVPSDARLEMPPSQPWRWFYIQLAADLENGVVQALVDGRQTGELETHIDPTLDTRLHRIAYIGGGPGNTGTLLLDDVSVQALPVATPLFTKVTAEAVGADAVLSWGVRDDGAIDGFAVYRRAGGGGEDRVGDWLPPTARSFTDAGLETGTTYSYTIEARTSETTTERSRTVSVVVETAPVVVFNDVRSRAGYDHVALSWDVRLNQAIDGFRVYRHSGSAGEEIDITRENLLPSQARAFDDRDVSAGRWYAYRIAAVTPRGDEIPSAYSSVQIPRPPVEISQVFPNPFRNSASLEFTVPGTQRVTVSVYDVRGKLVTLLDDRVRAAGPHVVTWNGRDSHGGRVSTGTYFFKLVTGDIVSTRKALLIR